VTTPPPAHVLAAFGVSDRDLVKLGDGGRSWRSNDIVLKPSRDAAQTAWLSSTFDQLRVQDVRIARPIRSSDGRWVVGGWSAQRFVSGRPAPRFDDIITTAAHLHDCMADLPRPQFLGKGTDLYSWADRVSWGEEAIVATDFDSGHGGRLFAGLVAGRRPIALRHQVVHGDLFGNVLFAGSAPPAVVDLVPFWRPPEWAAAVVVVDALSWGGAGEELLERWSHLPEWGQVLRRAVLFRLAVSLAHPRTTSESLVNVLSAAEIIQPCLD